MRLAPLAVTLHAITAYALPGRDQLGRRTEIPSYGLGSGTIASPTPVPTNHKPICNPKDRKQSNWSLYHMKDFTQNLALKIPSDNMGSFTNYVLSKAHGIYSFDCNILDGCESLDWNSCRAGSSMNPEYYWILESIKNFRDWVYVVITAVDRAQTDFASQTATLVTDFVNTDLGDNNTWIATLVAGILGVIAGIIAPYAAAAEGAAIVGLTAASGAAGAASGGASIGNGIANGAMTSADSVIQNEINQWADLDKTITHASDMLYNSILQFGNDAINGRAYNSKPDYYYYMNNVSGIVWQIQDGAFSYPTDSSLQVPTIENMHKAFFAAAATTLWRQQGVYIAKFNQSMPNGAMPCEAQDFESDVLRACDDNGNAYFFIMNTPGKTQGNTYKSISGADKLGDYGLDLLEVAQAAEWTQNQVGFSTDWSSEWLIDNMQNKDMPSTDTFISIPVCDLGEGSAVITYWPEVDPRASGTIQGCDTSTECLMKTVVSKNCGNMIMTVNGKVTSWPVEDFASS